MELISLLLFLIVFIAGAYLYQNYANQRKTQSSPIKNLGPCGVEKTTRVIIPADGYLKNVQVVADSIGQIIVPISNLKTCYGLLGRNGSKNVFKQIQSLRCGRNKLIKLEIADGFIELSRSQGVKLQDGSWKIACNLKVGDLLFDGYYGHPINRISEITSETKIIISPCFSKGTDRNYYAEVGTSRILLEGLIE